MKLDVLMHYEVDEHTGEVKFIGKEDIVVDTAKKQTKAVATLSEEIPLLKLNSNNYVLNNKACVLLGVGPGDTIHINYPKKDGHYIPAIGISESFGVKAGNKLTNKQTVSFRGAANEKLAEFGSTFEFLESDKDGIYFLKGDKVLPPEAKDAIEIDDSLDLDDLESLDSEFDDLDELLDKEESTDISRIDLTL